VHKFRRFSKKNKTFRTDSYYCSECGKRVLIVDVYGIKTLCWKCGRVFSMNEKTKIFPTCGECESVSENIHTLDFLEESISSPAPDIQERANLLLKELGVE